MKFVKIGIVFSFIVSFAACQQYQKNGRGGIIIAESKSYEASLYRQNCAICHGVEANGKEINGQLVPSLRYGDIEKRTEEEIYFQIAVGKLPMPGFNKQLTEDEMRRLVKFIRKDLQGKIN